MPPMFMGYHGPKPGTIWYTIQAIFMSTLFGIGAVIITYIAMVNGDLICLSGAVVCAIFCILFIIGYFVDTKVHREAAMKDAQLPKAKPPSAQPRDLPVQQTLGPVTDVAHPEVPSKEDPSNKAPTKDELI